MVGSATQTKLLFLFYRFPNISLATALHVSSIDVSFGELTSALNTLVNSNLLSRTRISQFSPWIFCVTESGKNLCADVITTEITDAERVCVEMAREEEMHNADLQQHVTHFLQQLAPFGVPMIVLEDFLRKQNFDSSAAPKLLSSLAAAGFVQNTCNGLLWCATTTN